MGDHAVGYESESRGLSGNSEEISDDRPYYLRDLLRNYCNWNKNRIPLEAGIPQIIREEDND